MFLSFLHPFPIRNTEAPYLWVFYKQVMNFSPDEICFMGSEDYFLEPAHYQAQNRWEFREECQHSNVYIIPTEKKIAAYRKYILAKDLFVPLAEKYQKCSNMIWQYLLTQDYSPLSEAIEHIVKEITAEGIQIDAFLAWCNTPSLDKIAKKYGKPVIYNEVGPLRYPFYLSTAYWDCSGVNGNTSAHKRYLRFLEEFQNSKHKPEILGLQQLQELFMLRRDGTECQTAYSAGVPLQVENDSNMLAYSNGFNNLNLCDTVNGKYDKGDVLIRKHPGGYFLLADNAFGVTDVSPSSLSFIYKCRTIYTINSSVGLETLLQGREVVAYGDCPYKFITNLKNTDERLLALNFFVFCYLIPYVMLYDSEYYRWLLQGQEEIKIFEQNKAIYKILKKNKDFEQKIVELEQQNIDFKQKIIESTNQQGELEQKITDLVHQNKELNLQIENLNSKDEELKEYISNLISQKQELEARISMIINTKGYHALEKIRKIVK